MAILVKNEDTRLYTTVCPNSGKESVILLHGGPGVPEKLEPVAEFLSQEFQVVYFHQRGTLNSPCPSGSFSMERYVSDVNAVATHFNLPRFHLFGHSWGGLYAQLYAAYHPEKLLSMFLSSPASGTGWQWAETVLEVVKFNKRKSSLQEWLALVKNASLGLLGSYEGYQGFYRQFALNCNKGYAVTDQVPLLLEHLYAKPINRTNLALLLHPVLQQQAVPNFKITAVYGDDDIYGDSMQYVRERYPTGAFHVIDKSSHFSWLHNEQAFFHLLAAHYSL
ncbi:proline iminopeptidase [Pontibacter ummariensis]|uniref:Proline iminopeptidase n=1 Tax=Pontibacter ummariensis TaxID=1610492 RepID=A0A239GP01_9BACT|nr:alpha/beta hydrolase [Pontibacter ummariensis]PRY11355.1 proline iminopeptidase [Pontibacter ummariensis]SNS70595.1 proline iminopeptidase [Pontibacter ummariensis]